MSSVVMSRPSAGSGRPRLPRCLVCDRDLTNTELATCRDIHAACPAQPEITFLDKVRAAAPVAGWPDGRCSVDLVCPRCAALINDIVIYESRLADMTQQLVVMVTNTTQSRAVAAEVAVPSADKPRARRPRKAPPKKNKPSEASTTSQGTAASAGPDQQQQGPAGPLDGFGEPEDADDPMAIGDNAGPEESLDLPVSGPLEETQSGCTWLVTTEPPDRLHGRPLPRSAGPQTCPLCHKQLASSSSLHKHMQRHRNERRFKCATCDKAFIDRRSLRRHEVDHTGVRPFCCSTCGKTLLSSHSLRVHQRSHLGIKPVECHVCHKKMSSAQMLREHLRIHTGERPFNCEICGRTFRTERILTSHQRTHTGVRPHVCDVCGRAFSQRTPLTAHLRSHTAQQLEAVRRERIGRTVIRTAEGIFDAKDGRTVQPLAVPAPGGGDCGTQQLPAVPDGAVGGPTSGADPPLAPLVPVCQYVADGTDGADVGGGGGIVGPPPVQVPVRVQDAMRAL